jgi:hypothetical protein
MNASGDAITIRSREGSGFGLSVKLIQAVTGNVMATATQKAAKKDKVLAVATAAAQEMTSPRISKVQVDWDAIGPELRTIEVASDVRTDIAQSKPEESTTSASTTEMLGRVNRATSERFANIAASPVPVLLPFNTTAFMRDRADPIRRNEADNHLAGFNSVPFFMPARAAMTRSRAKEIT